MKTSQNDETLTQGVENQETPAPDLANIKKWLTEDLGRCRMFLQSIHDQPDLLHQIAVHLKGKIDNHKNRPSTPPKFDQ